MRATVPGPSGEARLERRRGRRRRSSRAAAGSVAGHELVEVPAQAVLGAGALGDEVLAMVDEEADLALGAVEPGDRQVRLAQGRPGDREGVDRDRSCRARGPSGGRRP